MQSKMRVIVASLLIASSPAAFAGDDGGTSGATTVQQVSKPAWKIAAEFVGLAGSRDNAVALVNALRNGTPVTLSTTPATTTGGSGTGTPTATSITPATGKMGWGNVRIALALAEHVLAANGITQPTPGQLDAALNGGDLTVTSGTGTAATTKTVTLDGVLTQRASGAGWGQIAKGEGSTIGHVLGEARVASRQPATLAVKPATGTMPTSPASSTMKPVATKVVVQKGAVSTAGVSTRGVTTAAGATLSSPSPKGIVTASGASAGASPKGVAAGRGIVTAAGTGATVTAAPSAKAGSTLGVVSGTGAAASSVTTAQGTTGGNGKGADHGKGHGKG